jgi:hypothetical protein
MSTKPNALTKATPPTDHSDQATEYRSTPLGLAAGAQVDFEVIGEGGAIMLSDTNVAETAIVQIAFHRQDPFALTLKRGGVLIFRKSFRRVFVSWAQQAALTGQVSLIVFPAGVLDFASGI